MTWFLKDKINHIIHPFKYGFWCIMCVGKTFYDKHPKLGMLWETYDSYAGDGDYGFNYWWTDYRKTWKELIRLLPESWLQTRMLDLNYATLRNIYAWRHNHKLTEWHTFCDWIEGLPYAEELLIS